MTLKFSDGWQQEIITPMLNRQSWIQSLPEQERKVTCTFIVIAVLHVCTLSSGKGSHERFYMYYNLDSAQTKIKEVEM